MRLDQYRHTRKYGTPKQKQNAAKKTLKLIRSQLAKTIKAEQSYQSKLDANFDTIALVKKEAAVDKKYNAIIKKLKKEMAKPENAHDFVTLCDPEEAEDMVCAALTTSLYKCRCKVKYIHKNMNPKGKRSKMKKNVPLCDRHMKQVLESDDQRTPPNGFMFESDLYAS